jgi:hypothetical protein
MTSAELPVGAQLLVESVLTDLSVRELLQGSLRFRHLVTVEPRENWQAIINSREGGFAQYESREPSERVLHLHEWELVIDLGTDQQALACFDDRWEDRRLLAALADDLQDSLAEFVSDPVPPCPVHGHPLSVLQDDDGAWWACPSDANLFRCGIGHYHDAVG